MEIGTMTSLLYSSRGTTKKTGIMEAMTRLYRVGFVHQDMHLCGLIHLDHECSFSKDNWRDEVWELKKEAKRLGVHFHQAHLPYYYVGRVYRQENREFNELFDRMLRRGIEICGMLEIPCAVVHLFNSEVEETEEHIKENLIRYGEYVELAAQRGIRIAIENMYSPERFGSGVEDLAAMMDAFGEDKVGICWDFGHAQLRYGAEQADAIKKLKGRICAVHIHDNFGETDQHLPPFMGTIAWEKVMPALREAEFDGYLNYETSANRRVPEALRDEMARYCFRAGEHLIRMYEGKSE